MDELDPRIRRFFGNDEHPDLSWTYLHPADRAWIETVVLAEGNDPGILSATALQNLGSDDQRRWLRRVDDWHKAWPTVRTEQVKHVERHLARLPEPRPHRDHELLDVPLITGRPGTGKTHLLKREAVKALCRAAWDRRLDAEDLVLGSSGLIDPDWRPVIFHSEDSNPSVKSFFTHLCDLVGVPSGSDPQAAFRRAVLRHGIQTVFIDEFQMINFDGQRGMYLHNAVKALQNMNVRVILAGHNVRRLLVRRQTAAQNITQTQSTARWAFLDLARYPHETDAEITEWRKVLRALESHIRLTGHTPDTRVLSTTLEQHLWVITLGYMNSLAGLLTEACTTALRTRDQLITAKILDSIVLNDRVEREKATRLKSWRAGLFNWATDASEDR